MNPPGRWWETRTFAAAAILLAAVPLLWPAVPPLTDLPGHIGRYHIAAEIARSPLLQQHWRYDWAVLGNLGVDLLVIPLIPLVGVELAAKLVVMAIPPLTVAALIWLSREGGGRLSPAAPLAFPFAYSYPFQLGFVNFALAAGLALAALALWLRLERQRRYIFRAILFVPVSLLLWLAHSFGWGMFGLFACGAEVVALRRRGTAWPQAVVGAALRCVTLGLPLLLMLATHVPGDGAGLGAGYDLRAKFSWTAALLREHLRWYDTVCVIGLFCFAWTAVRNRAFRLDPVLTGAAVIGFAAWALLPYQLLGGAYVDMRMLPFAMAVLLIAVRVPAAPRLERRIALLATGFFGLRLATTTLAFVDLADGQAAAARIADQIPRGAAVLVLVQVDCRAWDDQRLSHVAGLAVARRDIFENGQWTLPGQQLLRARHPAAGPLRSDPSQLVYDAGCEYRPTIFDAAIRDFDRKTFDHVWTIGFPAHVRLAPDLVRVARDGPSTLYRITSPRARPVVLIPAAP